MIQYSRRTTTEETPGLESLERETELALQKESSNHMEMLDSLIMLRTSQP